MHGYQAPYGKVIEHIGKLMSFSHAYEEYLHSTENWKVILFTRQSGSHITMATSESDVCRYKDAFIIAGGFADRASATKRSAEFNQAYNLPRHCERHELIESIF